jgi:primary-amine oxidase
MDRPVEIHQVHLRPADFFTANPAIDVPGTKNTASVLVPGSKSCCENGDVQQTPVSHLQGTGPDFDPKSKL